MSQQEISGAASSAAGPSHHIVVDLNRCQGYAQCCFLAPTVFWLHGEEGLWYDPAPDESQWAQVLAAAVACPVQAIHLEGAQETISDAA